MTEFIIKPKCPTGTGWIMLPATFGSFAERHIDYPFRARKRATYHSFDGARFLSRPRRDGQMPFCRTSNLDAQRAIPALFSYRNLNRMAAILVRTDFAHGGALSVARIVA
ncbi:hypothetical protein [Cupriavidus necator]